MTKKSKPFVSVCTPTFNRRPFIPTMFECFRNQTYPKDQIEWIIIDDGTDKIKDLVKGSNIPQIKYYELPEKIPLGAKRNLMHEKAKGSIIVYMDDDDYYPPERIEHAVEVLTANKKALCAGSSELYLYFKHISKMYQFGPYGPNHATAGTFAFKRELLDITKYNENACIAEEREFLKDYTIPFAQLDPLKTILIFSHVHNTFDKRRLLDNPSSMVKESNKTVDMFIKFTDEAKIKRFFLNDIDEKLSKYEAGKPSMKPDVLKQTKEIDERRKQQQQQIIMQQDGKDPVTLEPGEIINMINGLRSNLKAVMARNDELEDMLEKKTTVTFSEPIEVPSSNVQKLKREISELEFKLKQSAIIEADLRADIDKLRKQGPAQAQAQSQAPIPVSAIMQTPQISELQFKLKQSSIIEAELRAEIDMLRKSISSSQAQSTPQPLPQLTPQPKPTVFIERLKSEPELFVRV
jgi:glycosyltransferase involved in cell wall biosynthesis